MHYILSKTRKLQLQINMNVKVNGTYVFLNTPQMTIDIFSYGWQNGNNQLAEIK